MGSFNRERRRAEWNEGINHLVPLLSLFLLFIAVLSASFAMMTELHGTYSEQEQITWILQREDYFVMMPMHLMYCHLLKTHPIPVKLYDLQIEDTKLGLCG